MEEPEDVETAGVEVLGAGVGVGGELLHAEGGGQTCGGQHRAYRTNRASDLRRHAATVVAGTRSSAKTGMPGAAAASSASVELLVRPSTKRPTSQPQRFR